jgi:2-keto-4-pentenoate hydratase/2-oxohepta-3-ene-1,7-dioic acid hydratase in catechol pathway
VRIVRFQREQCELCHHPAFYGILSGDQIEVLFEAPYDGVKHTGQFVPLSEVKLLAPVDPPNVIALGLNYRGHAVESKMDLPDHPLIFLKATTTVIGPEATILLPRLTPDEVDYEAELCLVIGKTASHVSEEEALEYVFGYTCGNDVSARDCQLRLDKQWARGKSYDTFCPLGPWIETNLDPDKAPIRARLNGQTMQDSNTSDLIFNCRQIIKFVSDCMTLLPGTVIMTGTPQGVGFVRQPPVYMHAGDSVEIEIDGIGTLRNSVQLAPR